MGGFLIGKLVCMAVPTNAAYLTVTDYRDLLREIRKIEPGMMKQFRQDARKIGNPLRNQIRRGIPLSAPLSKPVSGGGMVTPVGRLSWGRGVAANKAVLETRIPARSKREGALVKVVVSSPATVLADMAGRSGRYIGQRRIAGGTRSNSMIVPSGKYKGEVGYAYTYRNGKIAGRRHRNTGGQGLGLIRGLGSHPSRYVYKAAEKGLTPVRFEMLKLVNKYCADVTSIMRSR